MCYSVEEVKRKILPIAVRYQVNKVSIFGSYARGEANENSDIDLLIDKGNMKGLIEYFGFISELEDCLGVHVDVVTNKIKDKEFLYHISKDEVILYDKKGYHSDKIWIRDYIQFYMNKMRELRTE